jgi:YHS domain-containing protein
MMRLTLSTVPRIARLLLLIVASLILQACGTPYATTPNPRGDEVMLLGYDPVAYFTLKQPTRGKREITSSLPGRLYYFSTTEHKALFDHEPQKYEPQYGGFCSSGAAFAIKLGSDPTAWEIYEGRLFIFGDVLGHAAWSVDKGWNVKHADEVWPEMRDAGWRGQSLKRYVSKVPWYKTGKEIYEQHQRDRPNEPWPNYYDPGGMMTNLFLKRPGWRAAEGFGQPKLGYPD